MSYCLRCGGLSTGYASSGAYNKQSQARWRCCKRECILCKAVFIVMAVQRFDCRKVPERSIVERFATKVEVTDSVLDKWRCRWQTHVRSDTWKDCTFSSASQLSIVADLSCSFFSPWPHAATQHCHFDQAVAHKIHLCSTNTLFCLRLRTKCTAMATLYNIRPPNKKGPKCIWSARLLESKVMANAMNSFCPTTGVPCLNRRIWALMQ
jgi:hypothetical protein